VWELVLVGEVEVHSLPGKMLTKVWLYFDMLMIVDFVSSIVPTLTEHMV
jgi:hypothetical protein